MTSRYFAALSGDRLEHFTECMKQKGKFCHYHVRIPNDKTLVKFQNKGLLTAVGKDPKVYIVPQMIADAFKEKYPGVLVQYIESKVPEPRKHGNPTFRFKSANRNQDSI